MYCSLLILFAVEIKNLMKKSEEYQKKLQNFSETIIFSTNYVKNLSRSECTKIRNSKSNINVKRYPIWRETSATTATKKVLAYILTNVTTWMGFIEDLVGLRGSKRWRDLYPHQHGWRIRHTCINNNQNNAKLNLRK